MTNKVNIHLLVPNPDGPIKSDGLADPHAPSSGGRYIVACDPLAALPPHATGEARAATCPHCLATDAWAERNAVETGGQGGGGLKQARPEDFPESSPLREKCGCRDSPPSPAEAATDTPEAATDTAEAATTTPDPDLGIPVHIFADPANEPPAAGTED